MTPFDDKIHNIRLVSDIDMFGLKRKLVTGCGNAHLCAFFNKHTGDLVETFYSKGSTGGCLSTNTALSRMISLASRSGVPVEAIIDQLLSVETCPSYKVRSVKVGDTSKGASCPAAIGYALTEMAIEAKQMVKDDGYEGNIKYSDGSIGVAPILNNEQTTDSLVKKGSRGGTIKASNLFACVSGVIKDKPTSEITEGIQTVTNTVKGESTASYTTNNAVYAPSVEKNVKVIDFDKIGTTCPDCGGHMIQKGGCVDCPFCGWSRCG